MKKEIIAIDGPAASGKSTVAKIVASKLNYIYIDSGAMYRCVALYLVENNLDFESIVKYLPQIKIKFDTANQVYLNDVNVSARIRENDISNLVASVAKIKEVREYLVSLQQQYQKDKGVVMDGRDIGSVVFKDAKIKIYQVASVEARAQRRHEENIKNNRESNLQEIKNEILKRDESDMNRSIAPLVKVSDAVELDTSNLTIDESVNKILEIFEKKVKE